MGRTARLVKNLILSQQCFTSFNILPLRCRFPRARRRLRFGFIESTFGVGAVVLKYFFAKASPISFL
jgi:hypothetical protein